jgi:hypothetical protein
VIGGCWVVNCEDVKLRVVNVKLRVVKVVWGFIFGEFGVFVIDVDI